MVTEIRLPEVGEHIETATVIRVLVEPGQQIAKDQTIMELETEKATIEVPSTATGLIKEVMVKAGETLKVGAVILTLEEGEGSAAAPSTPPVTAQSASAPAPAPAPQDEPARADAIPQEAIEQEVEEEIMPASQAQPGAAQAAPSRPAAPPAPPEAAQSAIRDPQPAISPAPQPRPEETVSAAPAVRRLAREIGVEIADVRGSGPGGRISEEDVKRHAREQASTGGPSRTAAVPLPDFSRWGELERQPLPGIRRLTGEHVTRSWVTIPHVHQYDKADITELERLRREHNAALPAGAPKLTMTVILTKLMAGLLGRHPRFNASIDPASNELILKKYIHIGIAVDTERGLLVPVIRDVNKKSIVTLTAELGALSEKARAGKLSPDEMQGGTFTISNLGGIGGTSFNPIVNAPEVAILGVARSADEVVPVGGQPAVRLMLPLTLGYDHRVIDGAEGARFLHEAAVALANPFELLIEV